MTNINGMITRIRLHKYLLDTKHKIRHVWNNEHNVVLAYYKWDAEDIAKFGVTLDDKALDFS